MSILQQKPQAAQELNTDLEIMLSDQTMIEELITSILANKRLAWKIVDAWLKQNNCLLLPKEEYEAGKVKFL